MSSGSNSRPPRRDDARSSGPRRPSGKPGSSAGKPGTRSAQPTAGGRGRGGTDDRRGGRPASRSDSRGRPVKPMTEAERRSKAVKERRAPRPPQDPDIERRKIEERTTEQWIDEGSALELAQELHPNPALLPVMADCQRAQGRWAAVDRVWTEIKGASPSHDIMAEGRMVAAGALADQDDLRGALALMEPATKRPKAVRDFHLRQWYVLADLYDRTGDPISARRWFATILEFDDEFGDARDRLRSLGR